jgi:hypothetical protein
MNDAAIEATTARLTLRPAWEELLRRRQNVTIFLPLGQRMAGVEPPAQMTKAQITASVRCG